MLRTLGFAGISSVFIAIATLVTNGLILELEFRCSLRFVGRIFFICEPKTEFDAVFPEEITYRPPIDISKYTSR